MASPCVITYNGKDYTLDEFMKSVSQGEIAVGKEEENVVEKQLIDEVEGQIKQLKNDFFNEKITTSEYNKKLYPLEDKLAALKKGTTKEATPKEELTTSEPAAGATTPMPAGTEVQEVTKPVESSSEDVKAQEQEEVDTDKHPKYNEALKAVQGTGHASVPLIQRRLNTTYTQAQEIFRQLERDGHVLKSDENSNVYDVITPEVVEEKQPSSDALKDVESTAKAFERIKLPSIFVSQDKGGILNRENYYRLAQEKFQESEGLTNEEIFSKNKQKEQFKTEKGRLAFQEKFENFAENEKNKKKIISEAYHKAKKDGSNPELVKAVEELIGGQQQQSSPQPVKDETTPEQAKKRLDDDLELLKKIVLPELKKGEKRKKEDVEKFKSTAEQKFIGTIERAWLAKEQGKITKPEYTEFKKKAQQVLEGKIRAQDEAKATEAKLAVSKAMAKVKDRLVGKGHSPMALSAPIPVTPRTVADLIDLATSLANKAIDAGMEIKSAFAKAKRVVATHPTYMKLAKSGLLNEANFMAELDKAEYEVSKSLEELNPEPEAKQEGVSVEQPSEISGPWKPKKTGERLKASPKMKEVIKEMTEDDMMYLSVDMDKASEYVDNVLNQFQSEDKLTELAEEILAGNSPFPEKIKNVANARLADRLRVMSENINDTFQKRTLIQKAGKLWSERMKSINISATQVALERLVAKDLPLSTEGIKEMYQSAFQNTQEMAMGKETVEAVKDAYNSVQEALQTEEGAKTLREAVMSELERVAEALSGKEWLDKFNAARKKIKKDLSDC